MTGGLVYDATLRNLGLIGEAATQVPDAVRAALPHGPWPVVVATRNRRIHGQRGIDNDTPWRAVVSEGPALLPLLRTVKAAAACAAGKHQHRPVRYLR